MPDQYWRLTAGEFVRLVDASRYRDACAVQRALIIRSGFAGGDIPTIDQLLGKEEIIDLDEIREEVLAARRREVNHANQ